MSSTIFIIFKLLFILDINNNTLANNSNRIDTTVTNIEESSDIETLDIKITGYELNFNPEIKNYKLLINEEQTLDIKVNRSNDKVIISGNRDLKNNSIITILIDDNGIKTTYIIDIKKKISYDIYFIIIIAILIIINVSRIIFNNSKTDS